MIKVTEIFLDQYRCQLSDGSFITCVLKGNLKKEKVYVGDYVVVEELSATMVITRVLSRKNSVIRPPMANIDQMILCLSLNHPKPDYLLLDKELLLCMQKGIVPIICVNKMDLQDNSEEVDYLERVYPTITKLYVSAKENKNIEQLLTFLQGKSSAFSGNSGVGKSSLVNSLLNENSIVGEISERTNKGKHTTKSTKLFSLNATTHLFDTPGFSSYDLYDIESDEIKSYYPEFSVRCHYDDCNHVSEGIKECEVKKQIGISIDEKRYERYVYLYLEIKKKEEMKYKR